MLTDTMELRSQCYDRATEAERPEGSEGWKAGRLEGWKAGRLEGWKATRYGSWNGEADWEGALLPFGLWTFRPLAFGPFCLSAFLPFQISASVPAARGYGHTPQTQLGRSDGL
jgi:hypothetical protein